MITLIPRSNNTTGLQTTKRQSAGGRYEVLYCDNELPNYAAIERFAGYEENTFKSRIVENSSAVDFDFKKIKKESPVLKIKQEERSGTSITFNKWKGIVKDIGKETFIAIVTDLINTVPDEEVEFFVSDVRSDDKDLLSPGAAFYWCVGHVISTDGQIMRASLLVFQRLPRFDRNSLKKAEKKAFDIKKYINWK